MSRIRWGPASVVVWEAAKDWGKGPVAGSAAPADAADAAAEWDLAGDEALQTPLLDRLDSTESPLRLATSHGFAEEEDLH